MTGLKGQQDVFFCLLPITLAWTQCNQFSGKRCDVPLCQDSSLREQVFCIHKDLPEVACRGVAPENQMALQ
jgi:hypothetical protein